MSLGGEIKKNIKFNSHGHIPVIVQQYDNKEVLMLAWMNEEALELTLETGELHYWSRSRESLWRKGEKSGQTQTLKELTLDCDGDTLLAIVDQIGVACHTGRKNCFYKKIDGDSVTESHGVIIPPEQLYKESEDKE